MVACIPRAWPRWVAGKCRVSSAGDVAKIMAAPTAWRQRKTISVVTFGDMPQRTDPITNSQKPDR